MESRKAIINIVTVAFVAGSLYFMFQHNDVPGLVGSELRKAVTSADRAADGIASNASLGAQDSAASSSLVGSQPLAKPVRPTVSTPGPLVSKQPSSLPTVAAGNLTTTGIIADTNAERTSRSLPALKESKKLDASAQVKANDILARQYFEHTAPDGSTVSTLVDAQGYQYIRIGENLALGDFKDDADVVTAWMNSPGHRANILGASYTEMGVGVAEGYYKGLKVVVAVQHFGAPLSVCPSIEGNLKQQIIDGQVRLSKMSASLSALKAEIDREREQGDDVTGLIASYNAGIDTYNDSYAAVEKIRTKYNAGVSSFDACVVSLK